jgi:phenylalanyl-tRNA synthetase alpha chain
LIECKEVRDEYFELTEEGRRYLRHGLPEKRLMRLVRQGIASIDELKRAFEGAEIGTMWAKKKGWIGIRASKVRLTSLGLKAMRKKLREEKLLEELRLRRRAEDLKGYEDILRTFLGRRISRRIVERKRLFSLSSLGESLAQRIPKRITPTIDQLTPQILKTGLWRKRKLRKYDVTLPTPFIQPGKLQPYQRFINEVRERLIGLGFVEAKGPLVELNFWNCDALFMPSDHPARGIHDIYMVKEPRYGKIIDRELWERVEATHRNGWITGSRGWGVWDFELARRLILRSQGTSVSARVLARLKPEDLPYKMFLIAKVFRPDVIDAKHFIEFEHCEGIVVARDLNLRHLLGYLKEIALATGASKVRFKPSYFPFTEPSVELFVYLPRIGWVEAGGAGIFRPEVTLPLGVEVTVLAWGLGIGRLAMLKLGIDDIRYLYSDDLNWLRSKPVR